MFYLLHFRVCIHGRDQMQEEAEVQLENMYVSVLAYLSE